MKTWLITGCSSGIGTVSYTHLKNKIEKKVVITACGEQDNTYRDYIAEVYPNIQFVKCLQMKPIRKNHHAQKTLPRPAPAGRRTGIHDRPLPGTGRNVRSP